MAGDSVVETKYGFRWGPVRVERFASFPRDGDKISRCIGITSDTGQVLHVYVSPTGRSVRVFRGGRELKVTEEK